MEDWRKAGKIAAEALEYGKSLIKPDAIIRDVLDKVEQKIFDLGGRPAFPAQAALNDVAAHFCPTGEDNSIFGESLVSLDVGVAVNGRIGDTALTVDLTGKHSDLVKAAQEARDAAIKIVQIGTPLSEIGKTIQEVITSHGFSPVKNLTGHGLDIDEIHSWPSIPNIEVPGDLEIEEGVIAIEPFASTGAGVVYEGSPNTLFSLENTRPVRSPTAREVMKHIEENYLVFTTRWLTREFGAKARLALRELMNAGNLETHPPLIDERHGMVSQSEHSILVGDKVEILTKP